MLTESADGSLAPVVQAAGWLISAATAIGLAWRRRAKWEPAEEDVSKGPDHVGGLLSAVALALMWTGFADGTKRGLLAVIAAVLGLACLVALLVYGYLIATRVYVVVVSTGPNQSAERKIIGGSRLTEAARRKLEERPELTIQDLLEGSQYKPDLLWPVQSRAMTKMRFVAAYLGLVVFGTLALAAAAILLLGGIAG